MKNKKWKTIIFETNNAEGVYKMLENLYLQRYKNKSTFKGEVDNIAVFDCRFDEFIKNKTIKISDDFEIDILKNE